MKCRPWLLLPGIWTKYLVFLISAACGTFPSLITQPVSSSNPSLQTPKPNLTWLHFLLNREDGLHWMWALEHMTHHPAHRIASAWALCVHMLPCSAKLTPDPRPWLPAFLDFPSLVAPIFPVPLIWSLLKQSLLMRSPLNPLYNCNSMAPSPCPDLLHFPPGAFFTSHKQLACLSPSMSPAQKFI